MSERPRVMVCSFEELPGPNGLSRRLTEYLKALSSRFSVTLLTTGADEAFAREHPRDSYEQPHARRRSTLEGGLSRRNPVLR